MTDFSKPVRTKCGYPARILCTDLKEDVAKSVVAAVTFGDSERIRCYYPDGRYYGGGRHDLDLENVPETQKVYAAVYRGGVAGLPIVGGTHCCLDTIPSCVKNDPSFLGFLEIVAEDGKVVSVKMID